MSEQNQYLLGHIHACDALFADAEKFKSSVKKVTGLTDSGFKLNPDAVEIYERKKG